MPTPSHDQTEAIPPHNPVRRQLILASALSTVSALLGCGGGGGGTSSTTAASPLPPAPASPASLLDLNPPLKVNLAASSLPFEIPNGLAARPKKVFAHWFPPYPRSIDNAPPDQDYWAKNWLSATPRDPWEAQHAAYGGFHRERPAPRAPLAGDWEYADLLDDCQLAKAAGLDGFTVDILTLWKSSTPAPPAQADSQTQWQRILRLWDAAEAVGIKLIPMPDFEAHFKSNPDDLIWLVQELASKPASYRLNDGRLVLTAFNAMNQSAAWWATNLGTLKNQGLEIAFVPCFQDWQRYADDFAPISHGFAEWGDRTPAGALRYLTEDYAGKAHQKVSVWCAPVGANDVRPKEQRYHETRGSEGHRNAWKAAIEGQADWVQLLTWNDYSECSEIRPSTGIQGNFWLLSAYHTVWFKTGTPPTIVRERLLYFHRTHATSAKLIPGSTWSAGPMSAIGTPSDLIELVAFLSAPGRLEILIDGSVIAAQDVAAGLQTLTAPLREGRPSFRLVRANTPVLSATSLWRIDSRITGYDMIYRGADSSAT